MNNIGIVYHYIAHYRLPLFKELSKNLDPKFILISDDKSLNDIKTIDKNLAQISIENGGLRWIFVKNIWFIKDKLLWQKGLIKICLRDEFDSFIFLANPYFLSTWVACLILIIKHKPIYFWTHGLLKKEKGLKGWIRKRYYKLADGLLLYGNYAKELLINQGFNPEILHVIYNSLDHYKHTELRDTLTLNDLNSFRNKIFKNNDLPQLIFIGRLTKQKKINQILEALKILIEDKYYCNLLVVGDGGESKNLEDLCKKLIIINYVHFYGPSYNEDDNYKLIASSDLCVSPGEVGLTAIHSLSYGTPVLTHNNFSEQMPEFEAIVPDVSGDFFMQNDIKDLSERIKKWINTHKDRKEVQKNCYYIIDTKYNPKFQKDLICNLLEN